MKTNTVNCPGCNSTMTSRDSMGPWPLFFAAPYLMLAVAELNGWGLLGPAIFLVLFLGVPIALNTNLFCHDCGLRFKGRIARRRSERQE